MKTTTITSEQLENNTEVLDTISEESFIIIRRNGKVIASMSKFKYLWHVSLKTETNNYFSGLYLDTILTMNIFDGCEISFYNNIFEVIQ